MGPRDKGHWVLSYAEPSVNLRSIPPKKTSGQTDRPLRSSPFEGLPASGQSAAPARKPTAARSVPVVADFVSLETSGDLSPASDSSLPRGAGSSSPTQTMGGPPHVTSDQLSAILTANSTQQTTAMRGFADVIAQAMRDNQDAQERSTKEMEERHQKQMEAMQEKLNEQQQALIDALKQIDKTRQSDDVVVPKDFPSVDEFKYGAVTDPGAQSDFLVAYAQIAARMEAAGKFLAHTNWKKSATTTDGKARIKTVIDTAPNQKEAKKRLDKLEKTYTEEITTVYLEHLFIEPDQVLAETPDSSDGHKPSDRPIRDPERPFDTLEARTRADDYLYKLIVKTFKHADWQLQFTQKLNEGNKGAACMQLLSTEFDPKDLASAISATYAFLNANYAATTLEKHCTDMRSQFLKIKSLYFDKVTHKTDWQKMATELCATAVIRSLPDDMAKELHPKYVSTTTFGKSGRLLLACSVMALLKEKIGKSKG